MRRALLAVGAGLAALVGTLAGGVPASWGSTAAGWAVVGSYQMNETTRPVLVDSSGRGQNGAIGAHVVLGGGAHTYVGPPPAYDPARVDRVRTTSVNSPGSRDVRVTIRFRTSFPGAGHIVSWGQTPKPMVRIQLSYGRFFCDWRGTAFDGHLARTWMPGPYNDNAWHTVVCAKVGGTVTMQIDGGAVQVSRAHPVGVLRPVTDLVIAGKGYCNGGSVDCDYFPGYLDYVTVALR